MTDLPDSATPASKAPSAPTFATGSYATHHGHAVYLTLVHDDQTADVQEIDADGKVVLDENRQPKWTPKVPFAELS